MSDDKSKSWLPDLIHIVFGHKANWIQILVVCVGLALFLAAGIYVPWISPSTPGVGNYRFIFQLARRGVIEYVDYSRIHHEWWMILVLVIVLVWVFKTSRWKSSKGSRCDESAAPESRMQQDRAKPT